MVALVTDALPLRVTPDRLGTALSLMSQCDMIDFSDDGYAYSAKHTLLDQGRSTRAGA